LYSRPGNDISDRFKAITEAVVALPRRSLILDGELVAYDESNRPNFHLLRRKRPALVVWIFDILEVDGVALRRLPWTERRQRLDRLLARNRNPLLQLNDVWDNGEALLRACADQDLEGVVSKLRSAPYISGMMNACPQ
jgi:bifunctional non-homologous end joining protein LigD